jgi:hypothetical protein
MGLMRLALGLVLGLVAGQGSKEPSRDAARPDREVQFAGADRSNVDAVRLTQGDGSF